MLALLLREESLVNYINQTLTFEKSNGVYCIYLQAITAAKYFL